MPELAIADVPSLPASPWSERANRAAAVAALVASTGLAVAWNGISQEATFAEAQPWFFLAAMALLLGFAAAVLWLSSAAKRISGVRSECHEILRSEFGSAVPVGNAVTAEHRDPRYVRAAGMVKVHLDSCEFVAGKDYDEVPPAPGAERCGVCSP